MTREHTCKHYEARLWLLRDKLMLMGHSAETMVGESIQAIEERRPSLGEVLINQGLVLNRLEYEIDRHCVDLLALDHPLASDLRLVLSAFKIVKDLKGVGGQATNIGGCVRDLCHEAKIDSRIATLGRLAQATLTKSLDSLGLGDVNLAEEAIQTDYFIDIGYEEIFREELRYMTNQPQAISEAVGCVFVAKAFERIGDHAVNIAEMVIFLARGLDVRHQTRLKPALLQRETCLSVQ